MILRFILIIFSFSPFASAQDQISIDYLNNALKQNYLFIERSLNKSSLNIEESSGKFFFNKSQLIVEILSPYKERYLINETSIEIHDLDLDQTINTIIDDLNDNTIAVSKYKNILKTGNIVKIGTLKNSLFHFNLPLQYFISTKEGRWYFSGFNRYFTVTNTLKLKVVKLCICLFY